MGLARKIFFVFWIALWIVIPVISNLAGQDIAPELLKVKLFLITTRVLIIFLVLFLLLFKPKIKLNHSIISILGIWLFMVLVSWILSVDPLKSWFGNYYRQDGIETLSHLLIIPAVFAFFNPKLHRITATAIAVGCLLTSILINTQVIKFIFQTHNFLALSNLAFANTHGQPNFAAGYIVVSFPFLIYAIQRFSFPLSLKTLVILQPIFAILFTQSRGGILSLIVIICSISIVNLKNSKIKLIFSLITIFCIVFFTTKIYFARSQWVQPESRARIITTLALSLKTKPYGWGWANIDYAFQNQDWPIPRQTDIYVDKAHSHWLEMAVTTGIQGLLTYMAFQFLVFRSLYKSRNNQLYTFSLISLVTFVIHSQTNVISISEEMIFWALVGFSLTVAQEEK